jgi:anti-sigma factor RsiW
MNCADFKELISERIAGELSQEQASEFDAHRQICPACHQAMLDWQQMESLLRASWPTQDIPAPFSLPASKVQGTWLSGIRSWVSAASTAIVAASLLLLILFRPSIQFNRHQLSMNFDRTAVQPGAAPAAALNQSEVEAMVQASVERFMTERSPSASRPTGTSLNDEQSRRLAELAVQLEIVKQAQAALWQEVEQHGLYLQSAWLGSAEQQKPDRGAHQQ